MNQRQGLVTRIRQIRRASAEAETPTRPSTDESVERTVAALETRISHLEQLLQGLQDSVHRESTRLSSRVGELEAQIQPAAINKALSADARERGL